MSLSSLQTAAIVVALTRASSYPAFAWSLAFWLPIAFTWSPLSPSWTFDVWLPFVLVFSVCQGASVVEAMMRFGRSYRLSVVTASIATGLLAFAAALYSWHGSDGGIIAQTTSFCVFVRVWAGSFLVLSVGLFAAVLDVREFWRRREGRHLILLTLFTLTYTVPTVIPRGVGWGWWVSASDLTILCRVGVLGVWAILVPVWTSLPRGAVSSLWRRMPTSRQPTTSTAAR